MASTADVALIEDDSGNSQDNDKPLQNDYNPSLKDGRQAWLVCLGGFLLQVLIVGVLHVFGVFFVHFIDEFGKSKAEVAWVGSAAYGLSMAFGPITGLLVERYGARPITMVGCFICALSLLLTSFVVEMETMFASFSVLYGLGTSLAYTPTMTIAQDYFDKYVSIATGIMTAGSSTGTLILAPLTQALIDSVGWRNTMRAFVGTCLFSMCCAFLFKPLGRRRHKTAAQRLKAAPSAHGLLHEFALWKSRVFILWTLALMCVMFGYYIPYVHLVSYAQDVGVHPDQGSKLIMCLGAATAIGRISFGKIVQYGFMSRIHMHQLSMVVTGAGVMMLPLIKSFPLLVMYVWIVGLVDGCFVVLLPLMTATLVGADKAAIAWGFFVGACSITFTLGPPVAGWLYDSTGSYNLSFHISGIPILLGAVLLFLMPWAQRTSRSTNALIEVAEPERTENGDDDEREECIYMNRATRAGAQREDASQGTSNSRYAEAEMPHTQRSLLAKPDAAYLVSNAKQVDCNRSTESLPANLMTNDRDADSLNSANLIDITDIIEDGQQAISRQRMFELYRRERLTSGRVRAHTWTDNTYNPAPGELAITTATSPSSNVAKRGNMCSQNADNPASSPSISPFLSPHPSQETVPSLTSIPAITPTATPTASQLYLMTLRQAATSPIPPSDESSSAILSSSYPSPTGSSMDMMVSLYNSSAILNQQDSNSQLSSYRSSSPPTIFTNAADVSGSPVAQRLSPPQATTAPSSGTVTTTATTSSRSFVNAVQLETIPEIRHSQPTNKKE